MNLCNPIKECDLLTLVSLCVHVCVCGLALCSLFHLQTVFWSIVTGA